MTLSPVTVESFGGLNLVDDPGAIGWNAACDALNVMVDRGVLRTRPGLSSLTTNHGYMIHSFPGTPTRLVIEEPSRLAGYDTSGGLHGTQTKAGFEYSYANMSLPSAEYMYAVAVGADSYRYDGTTWTTPGSSFPKGGSVAVTPWDNRLVMANTGGKSNSAGPAGASSSDVHIWFSDAGDPTTWGANNFVEIIDEDPSAIMAMATYGNQLFVFKRRSIVAFYGTSEDSTGNPIFNWRRVDNSLGSIWQHGVAVAPEGIYFHSSRGLCLTSGGPAQVISQRIDPLFGIGSLPSFFYGYDGNPLAVSLPYGYKVSYAYGLVFVSDGVRTIVYDTRADAFYLWSFHGTNSGGWAVTSLPGTDAITYVSTSNGIGKLSTSLTTDFGTSIPAGYRSGFADLGTPDMKRIHSWRAVGSGTPTLQLSTDFGALESGGALTLGTSPAIKEGFRRYAPRGRKFSWQLSATSGAWAVNNLTAMVAGKRDAGEYTV